MAARGARSAAVFTKWVAHVTGDEGVQVLIHLDDFTGPVLSGDTSRRELTERLERLSRGASQNDTLKLQLLSTPGMAARLLQLLTLESASPTARNHAAKVIEYIGSHPDGARQMVDRGMHETVLRLVRTEGASLYVRKALATLTCHLAAAPANVPILARAGAVSALHDEQESPCCRHRTSLCHGEVPIRPGR